MKNLGDRKRDQMAAVHLKMFYLMAEYFFIFKETEDGTAFDETASSWNLQRIRSRRKTITNITKNQVILETFHRLPLEDKLKCYSNGFMVMTLNT